MNREPNCNNALAIDLISFGLFHAFLYTFFVRFRTFRVPGTRGLRVDGLADFIRGGVDGAQGRTSSTLRCCRIISGSWRGVQVPEPWPQPH